MNKEDNIRQPDPIFRDTLIPTFQPKEDDYALKKAIKNSQKTFEKQQDEETFNAICNDLREFEQKERQTKFSTIKTQLHKLILFDKVNVYYYEVILSVIEMYEQGLINTYNVSEKEHINIFSTLKTIRLPITEVDALKKIIMY